jgi:hypothetical protein
MDKRGVSALLLSVLILPGALLAQEGKPFVPFVSRLEYEIKNNLIRLSWIDSPDIKGPVFIYRSPFPFDEDTNLAALRKLAEVPYGAQSYVDEAESPGTWYYFAAASDVTGRLYDLPIAMNNNIGVNFEVSALYPGAGQSGAAESRAPPAPENPVKRLEAAVEGDAVIVSFTVPPAGDAPSAGDVPLAGDAPPAGRKLVLYRSVEPLKENKDLLRAVIVQPDITSPFTDYPVPGIPYYYAVISEEDLVRGTVNILPGRNATTAAVEVPANQSRAGLLRTGGDIRGMPLPVISPGAAVPGMNTFTEMPVRQELSPEAEKALENLYAAKNKTPAAKKSPFIFPGDLEETGGGEEYALRLIIQTHFAAGDWENCRDEMRRFLSLPRSRASEIKARFYLGQCYYFLGEAREGLFEFLDVKPDYPAEAGAWIDASLKELTGGD